MTRQVAISNNPILSSIIPSEIPESIRWSHTTRATIGFDSASFSVLGSQSYLELAFSNWLGRRATRYTLSGHRVAWEGFISELTLNLPGITYRVSLESLYNRVRVRYTPIDTSVSPPVTTGNQTSTATAGDTDSQNKYGIRDLVLSAGQITATQAAQIRDAALAQYKRPRRSASISSNAKNLSLEVSCLGYGHTLGWQVYNQTASGGTQNANLEVSAIEAAAGQFIAATDLSTNTLQVGRYRNSDRTALDQLLALAQLGDASGNRWLIRVFEDRTLYYRQASSTVKYTRRLNDGRQEIFSLPNMLPVTYDLVRPDYWIRTSDAGLGQTGGVLQSSNIEDFQLMYIESVTYSEQGETLDLQGSVFDGVQASIARLARIGEAAI